MPISSPNFRTSSLNISRSGSINFSCEAQLATSAIAAGGQLEKKVSPESQPAGLGTARKHGTISGWGDTLSVSGRPPTLWWVLIVALGPRRGLAYDMFLVI